MYIKLGKTHINYNTQETLNKYTIIGQIINTPISYESPALVNTSKELNIWFSNNFKERDYFLELLKNDVTLYLYKPMSDVLVNMNGDVEFINYDNWEVLNIFDGEVNDITISIFYVMKTLEKGGTYKYRVLNSEKTEYNYYIWVNGSWVLTTSTEKKCLNENCSFNEKDLDDISKILESDQFKIPTAKDPEDFWIWQNEKFVVTSQLPQNLENFSESLNNRDTLTITNSTIIPYTHPEFTKIDKLGVYSDTFVELESDSINLDRINEGKDTLAFYIKNTYTQYEYNGMYFVIIDPNTGKNHLFYNGDLSLVPEEIQDFCEIDSTSQLYPRNVKVQDFIIELRARFIGLGYVIEDIGEFEFRAYSSKPVKVTYFNNLPGLIYRPEIKKSYNIISKKAINEGSNVIEFWSKTIGGVDHDEDRIKVNIEKVEIEEDNSTGIDTDPYYRITISKYDYSETFEAPTRSVEDNTVERLDYVISKKSKLVYCSIKQPGKTIKEGDYVLRGGIDETKKVEWNETSWKKSLSILFNGQVDPVYPDFFLIENINKYGNNVNITDKYYTYYGKMLEYAKEFNCQFLIQNNDTSIDSNICLLYYEDFDPNTPEGIAKINQGIIPATTLLEAFRYYKDHQEESMDNNCYYTVISDVDGITMYYINGREITGEQQLDSDPELIRYTLLTTSGNDFIFNYTKDTENRLVYFYKSMLVDGYYRPGYYLFLNGILSNKFSISTNRIIYQDPVENDEDVYAESGTKLFLENYKSNYMINNNLVYFYKEYQNGKNPKPTTSILLRFIAGKIQRELQKNRWKYLGEKNMSKIQDNIESILNKIQESYKIVNYLELIKFIPDMSKNKLDIEMNVHMDDLVDKDITLDVTIDYSDFTN